MIYFRGSMCRKAEEMDYPHLCESYRVHAVFPAAFSVLPPPVSQMFLLLSFVPPSRIKHAACFHFFAKKKKHSKLKARPTLRSASQPA